MVSILYSYSTALGSKTATLEDFIVDEPYRAKGYGTKLLRYALKESKKKECKRITLLTDNTNLVAQKLYKKFQFENSQMIVMRNFLF